MNGNNGGAFVSYPQGEVQEAKLPTTLEILAQDRKKLEEQEALKLAKLSKFNDGLLDENQIEAMEVAPTEWIVPGFLPKPALVALTGKPGSFKTFFAHWIARRLGAGLPLFDTWEGNVEKRLSFVPFNGFRKVKVLIVEEEMGPEIIKERSGIMKCPKEAKENVFWAINSGFSVRGDKGEAMKALLHTIAVRGIEVVIFDPFTSISGMTDENDNSEAREVMDMILKSLVNDGPKVTVIFLHHPSKGDGDGSSIRGAGDILGKAYVHYTMVYEREGGDGPKKIGIRCGKTRWQQLEDFNVEFRDEQSVGMPAGERPRKEFVYAGLKRDESGDDGDGDGGRVEGRPRKIEDLADELLGRMESGKKYTKKQLGDMIGYGVKHGTFRKLISLLKNDLVLLKEDEFALLSKIG